MLQKGAAFLKHPHLALPLAAGLRHSGSAQRVFCGFRTANSVRLKKTVPNQRFGTVFLLFLGFFGGAEGLQALLDEVGDGTAADAMVMEENRQFGYLNPCTDDTVIRQKSGQVVAGGAIGVLCHEKIWFPTLPGNVMNAWTYNFPVQFQFLFECTEMPPYAYLIQAATQCRVYDFITMLNWVHSGLCRRPFTGWV